MQRAWMEKNVSNCELKTRTSMWVQQLQEQCWWKPAIAQQTVHAYITTAGRVVGTAAFQARVAAAEYVLSFSIIDTWYLESVEQRSQSVQTMQMGISREIGGYFGMETRGESDAVDRQILGASSRPMTVAQERLAFAARLTK